MFFIGIILQYYIITTLPRFIICILVPTILQDCKTY